LFTLETKSCYGIIILKEVFGSEIDEEKAGCRNEGEFAMEKEARDEQGQDDSSFF
jgi:hypothetical protein